MAGYIITFRLSDSQNTEAYNERRTQLYDYFKGFKSLTNETKESTTSTIFWKSDKEFDKNNKSGEIIYDLKKKLNKDDELLIIILELGIVKDVVRIKDLEAKRDEEIYKMLILDTVL